MMESKYWVNKCGECPYFHQYVMDEDKWCEKHNIIVNPNAYPCIELQEEAIKEEREKYERVMKKKKNIMKAVYKYQLKIDDYQQVILPVDAKILCIKVQNGTPCLWALIDKEQTYDEEVTIRCAGTGHGIKDEVEYIDTIMVAGGELVFHFFKVLNWLHI